MAYAILLISPGRWLQAKTQQPIGVVSLVIIIHVNGVGLGLGLGIGFREWVPIRNIIGGAAGALR